MARIKFLFSLIFLIVLVAFLLVFYFRNSTLVPVDLIFFQTEVLGVGFWILISFLAGALVGVLVAWPSQVYLRFTKKSKEKKLDKANTELMRVKNSASNGG